jgi:uncharacterized protein YndB with AHSA1/START domain
MQFISKELFMTTLTKNQCKISVIPGKLELAIERELDAPRELVFKALIDPKLYAQWVGPRKLTMKIERFDAKNGGSWRFIHTESDGKKHSFHGVFHEVTKPERIIRTFEYENLLDRGHAVLETVRLEALPGERTRLISQSVFQSVVDRDGMYQAGMERGIEESYERLDELLETLKITEGHELVITRLLDAPKEVVFRAWTDPERIKRWWGPEGFTAPVINVDLRTGGRYLYAMEDQSGRRYWSAGEFLDVDIPNRVAILDYFSDENGHLCDPTDYGLDKHFPKETNVTVTFDEEHGKTRLNIIYELPRSAAERESIHRSGMVEGWNSSLNKLEGAIRSERLV